MLKIFDHAKDYAPMVALLLVPLVALRAFAASYYRPDVALAIVAESSLSNIAAVLAISSISILLIAILTVIGARAMVAIIHRKFGPSIQYGLLFYLIIFVITYMESVGWLLAITMPMFLIFGASIGRSAARQWEKGNRGPILTKLDELAPRDEAALRRSQYLSGALVIIIVLALPVDYLAPQRLELRDGSTRVVNVLNRAPDELVVLTKSRTVDRISMSDVKSVRYCDSPSLALSRRIAPTGYPKCPAQ